MAEGDRTATVMFKPAAERFEIRTEHGVGFVAYSLVGSILFLAYTETPDALTDRAEQRMRWMLMRGAFEYAREHELSVVPICPIARVFVEEVPEYEELVREEDR